MKRSFRRYLPLGLLALLALMTWLAYYAYDNGFTKKWRKIMRTELAKRNLEMDFAKLTLDPVRGLVAKDVTLYQDPAKKQVLAKIADMRLGIDLGKLVSEEVFLDRIELSETNLSIPFDRADPNSPRLELKHFTATVLLFSDHVEIANAEAEFEGVKLGVTGTLTIPKKGQSSLKPLTPEQVKLARSIHDHVSAELRRVQVVGGRAPQLKVELSGDLSDAKTVQAQLKWEGERFAYRGFWVKKGSASAHVSASGTRFDSLVLEDESGKLFGSVALEHRGKLANFQFESTLSWEPLLRALQPLAPYLAQVDVSRSPSIKCTGQLRLDEISKGSLWPADLLGAFSTGPIQIRGATPVDTTKFQDLAGAFHFQGPRWFLRNLVLKHASGVSKGQVMSMSDAGLRYEGEVGMDPTVLRNLPLPSVATTFLKRWTFPDNSKVLLTISGERKGKQNWQHQGTINLARCTYGSTALDSLVARFQGDRDKWRLSDFRLELLPDSSKGYPGGSVRGEDFSISTADRFMELRKVQAEVQPAQLLRPFSDKIADHLERYQFEKSPSASFSGTIDPNYKRTDLSVTLKTPANLTTTILAARLPFSKPSATLRFKGRGMSMEDASATLFGGKVVGKMNLESWETKAYTAEVSIDQVPFAALAEHYFPQETTEGEVTGHFQWSAHGADPASVKGAGAFHLVNGHILAVPVLGPLSTVLKPLVGKATFSQVRDLNSSFRLENRVLLFDSVQADMKDFEINGSGQANMQSEQINFEAELSNRTAAKILVEPIYKLLGRFTCTGTLKDPQWHLALTNGKDTGKPGKGGKIDPRRLLNLPGELLKTLTPPPLRGDR